MSIFTFNNSLTPPFINSTFVVPVIPNNSPFTDPFIEKIQEDILQEFNHWYAVLDIKQYYLGRMFLYAKRLTATDMIALNKDEREELWVILKKVQKIYAATFQPEKLNFAFLGNDKEHCHLHIIPRYQTPRVFDNVTFKDNQWGHNYSAKEASKFKIDKKTHKKIYLELKQHF